MGYFMEESMDGSVTWRRDTGCKSKKSDKKKFKRIRRMRNLSKRANRNK